MKDPVRVWIVCTPCPDSYYDGSPNGMVFYDEEDANVYIRIGNGEYDGTDPHYGEYALYLVKGYLQ